jgi:hypothetical protein
MPCKTTKPTIANCEYCDKGFTHMSNLSRHKKICKKRPESFVLHTVVSDLRKQVDTLNDRLQQLTTHIHTSDVRNNNSVCSAESTLEVVEPTPEVVEPTPEVVEPIHEVVEPIHEVVEPEPTKGGKGRTFDNPMYRYYLVKSILIQIYGEEKADKIKIDKFDVDTIHALMNKALKRGISINF